MIQYTTPTIRLTVEGVDLTPYTVYVTIRQGSKVLTVTEPDVTAVEGDTQVDLPLSQVQTGGFRPGAADVQVNWYDGATGSRDATTVGRICVTENLLREVIGDG